MQENIARSVLQKGLTKGFYKKVFLKTWDLLITLISDFCHCW